MDISTLNTKDPAEQGAFLHLRHPVTGELLHNEEGKPSGVMVRGTESATVQKALRKINKRGGEDAQRGLAFVSALVFGFVNLTHKGRALEDTDEDKATFFGISDSFVEQVVDFAKDRGSFFGNASKP